MSAKKTISKEDVLHLARLAKLELNDGELTLFSQQLTEIIDYVGQLDEVQDSSIPHTSPVHFSSLRNDMTESSLASDQVFLNAKRTKNKKFHVNKIL